MPLILDNSTDKPGIPVVSLKEYLSQDRVLVIPPWQREYSWSTSEDEQVDTLLKDLLKFIRNPNSEEYLIGSVVLCALPGEEKRPLLIDGQQRTLTLTLLLMCCQKYLKTFSLIDGNDNADTQLNSELISCINGNAYGMLKARVEMKRSDADVTLRELYDWSTLPGEFDKSVFKNMDKKNLTQKNLISSAEFIFRNLMGNEKVSKDGTVSGKPGNWLTPDEMKKGISKLLNKVKLIQISVNDKRESISVFDHINNRGMALNPADLVKNLMFESVKDNEFDVISENWNNMTEILMLTKKSRLQDPRFILRSISHVEYGAHESYDNLDVYWSRKFEEHQNDASKGISALEFSKKLPKYAHDLKSLVLRDPSFRYSLSDIYLAGELGSVQHYSVLLAGTHFASKETFQLLCRQVNFRTLLYMLAGEKTQSFDAMIPDWAASVRELPESATKSDLISKYQKYAKPDEKLFASLKENMLEWDYTTSSKKKIRSVLALLSVELNSLCNQAVRIEDAMRARRITGESHAWEIEHVFPQSKDKSPQIQSIGNLVLLSASDNNNLSASEPELKVEHYKHSSLMLTKTLSGTSMPNSHQQSKIEELIKNLGIENLEWNLLNWNEVSIAARADFYYKYLSHIIKSVEVAQ
ncbi:Domain of unknown function DUF262 [Candidatus Nanopelagicaceae bacterium]